MTGVASAAHNGIVLSRYELHDRLAAGSVGSVFIARDQRTGHRVAVKLFDTSEDQLAPWADEMRLALRLVHPNIVSCLDTGYDKEQRVWALVFKLALGGSLRRVMASGYVLSEYQITRLLADIAKALAYAHQCNVTHRDVKPENILAEDDSEDSRWLLTDFGAGRFLMRGTSASSIVGSLAYMAPEVLLRKTSVLCDQFSLGMVGMELLTSHLPSHSEAAQLVLSNRHLPGLWGVVARLAQPLPDKRFPDMDMVVWVLDQLLACADAEAAARYSFDLTQTRDGRAYLLCGTDVMTWPARAPAAASSTSATSPPAPTSAHVPNARRFINVSRHSAPIIACERRLVVLEAQRPVTLYVADQPFDALAASAELRAAWVRRGDQVSLVRARGDARELPLPLPAPLGEALQAGRRPLGALFGNGYSILTVDGASVTMLCRSQGDTQAAPLAGRVLTLPGPVRELLAFADHGVLLCGTLTESWALRVGPQGVDKVEHFQVPPSMVSLTYDEDGRPRRTLAEVASEKWQTPEWPQEGSSALRNVNRKLSTIGSS